MALLYFYVTLRPARSFRGLSAIRMHSSIFEYSITRAYPYRWFTPVAIVGGLVSVVLLSVMNFVQNGYTLTVQYVDDPNSTISNSIWYSDWPSYFTSSVRPTCQPTNLPINTQFFTNQSGLTWTLTSIFQRDNATEALPSLPYMNNPLEECAVRQIHLDFDGTEDRNAAIIASSPWDIQVRAFATCRVWSPVGWTSFNLTAMYDPVQPYTVAGSSVFVARDAKARASLFWAEALLSAYWVASEVSVADTAASMSPTAAKGVADLYPYKVEEGITGPEFFNLSYSFLGPGQQSNFGLGGTIAPMKTYIDNNTYLYHGPFAPIWPPVDSLAKSMYSAVMADLGQVSVSTRANIVANETTLEYFTANFSDALTTLSSGDRQLVLTDYWTRQNSSTPTGPLGLTASVVSTRYLCQVPKRRPIGDIFISVLLADLVLLQAIWKLYTFTIQRFLLRTHSNFNHCEGCIKGRPEVLPDESDSEVVSLKDGRTLVRTSVLQRSFSTPVGKRTRRNWWLSNSS